MLMHDGEIAVVEGRWGGETHRLELNGELRYTSPALQARLDPRDFSLVEVSRGEAASDDQALTLEPCASMYVLLQGLSEAIS